MATKLDTRQSVNRSALSMVGSAANDSLDTILPKIDAELAKLFEDRNVMLQNGGIITFTGTQIQFTENLELAINQKISGAAPQVISLGMANVNLNNNEMWYATVDRGAGTAAMNIASTLPAVTSANQEIFLIAKRVDAGDGTQRVYWRNGMALNAGQSVRLGASGSGSGSGTGDDLIALQFRASFQDNFDEGPADSKSAVDITAGKTDAATYNAAKAMYTLNYDASKTIAAATTTTNINISADASFTVKIGDMVIFGSQARRITAVATQASFTTDAFDAAPTLAEQVTISQAVHTKDIYNLDVDGNSIADAFPAEPFSEILLDYEDTSAAGDNIFDINVAPVVAFDASHDGTTFTDVKVRPTLETDTIDSIFLEAAGTALYVRLYANKTSGSGIVNVLRYKTSLQKQDSAQAGGIMNSAYAFTNGVGTPVNCTVALMGGKTALTLNWNFAVGVLPGTSASSVEVWINGQKIPRFIDVTLTPDAYFTEEGPNVIKLDRDYSGYNLSVEVFYRTAIVDASISNSNSVFTLQEIQSVGFQAFVAQNQLMNATTTVGSPIGGTFHSTISGRSAIVDLSQDLKVRMGPERMTIQQLFLIPNEVGPATEQVFGTLNDLFGQMRFAGNWNYVASGNDRAIGQNVNDFMEITFYGTGLDVLFFLASDTTDIRVSVDGGAEGSNVLLGASTSAILFNRNYKPNQAINVAANLSLGVHTVKLRYHATGNTGITGFEILTEASGLRVTPGASYSNGKKLSLSALQSIAYNSSFESGTLGTRGGHVVVYQKADGTIGKAVNPAGSQLNLTAANHANEEVSRVYMWREFGANRSDDFSTLQASSSSRAFTLEDGTATLQSTTSVALANTAGETLAAVGSGDYTTITFIGTGLDIVATNNGGASGTITTSVNGTSIGTILVTAAGIANQLKQLKVVSGLPYGTHTVRFNRDQVGTGIGINRFVVYQPKKPSIPSGSTELGSYNIMADYVANTVSGVLTIATGVMRKSSSREGIYVNGTGGAVDWTATFDVNGTPTGLIPNTDRQNAYVEYTFWGTGFEYRARGQAAGVTTSAQLSLQSLSTGGSLVNLTTANYPTAVMSNYGIGFTPSTGIANLITGGTVEGGIAIRNLPLGLYKFRVLNNNAGQSLNIEAFDIIMPIHVGKSELVADLQNTLPVGSTAISDNRKITPVKDALSSQKFRGIAVGVQATPSTSSSVYVPIPDMSLTIKSAGEWFEIRLDIDIRNGSGTLTGTAIFINGFLSAERVNSGPGTNIDAFYSWPALVYLAPGVHKVDGYWRGNGATLTNFSNRVLTAKAL